MMKYDGERLPVPENVRALMTALDARGFRTYAVGGCVRDMLLGVAPHDWDLCSSATPEQCAGVFASRRVLPTGVKHGTVTVLTEGGPVEITTFRTESGYSDGRHPDSVSFAASLREDLSRRDFTVNAMAADAAGDVTDMFGGRDDLAARIIRCVGEPELRFREDALRILRALRFASRLGFEIEVRTAAALSGCRELLGSLSAERVFSELKGILSGSGAGELLTRFPDVIAAALPCLDAQRVREAGERIARTEDDRTLRLALLLGDAADGALRSLKSDGDTRGAVLRLLELQREAPPRSRYEARLLLSRYSEAELAAAQSLWRARGLGDGCATLLADVSAREGSLTPRQLCIGGDRLLALGFSRGKPVGEALSALFDLVLRGELENTPEALERAAVGMLQKKTP